MASEAGNLLLTLTDTFQDDGLLRAGEPGAATRVTSAAAEPRCLLVADHASNRVPAALDNLGLSAATLQSHLAWDIGTDALVRALAECMSLPAIVANYSRLVVDCNRAVEDPSAFLTFSDGVEIQANCGLSAAWRRKRLTAVYWPYHQAVEKELLRQEKWVERAALISIHSFTPVFDGKKRHWDCGVLWDKDPRIAVPLMAGLASEGLTVGDNEPYSGRSSADYTVDTHAEAIGRAHVAIEVRQDQISSVAGVAIWADRLSRVLKPVLENQILYQSLQKAV